MVWPLEYRLHLDVSWISHVCILTCMEKFHVTWPQIVRAGLVKSTEEGNVNPKESRKEASLGLSRILKTPGLSSFLVNV